jgi:hypothetical protein
MHKAKVARAAEPSIEEMLGEPIVRALMAADGVRVNELEALIRSVAERLRASRSRAPTSESFGLSNPETTQPNPKPPPRRDLAGPVLASSGQSQNARARMSPSSGKEIA